MIARSTKRWAGGATSGQPFKREAKGRDFDHARWISKRRARVAAADMDVSSVSWYEMRFGSLLSHIRACLTATTNQHWDAA